MEKKNYIVFGGTSGIGESCVKHLASSDTRIIVVGRDEAKLSDLEENIAGEVYPVVFDLNELENIKDIYKICEKHSFKLDGMVYSAGIDAFCPIKANNIHQTQKLMNVNCMAFVEASKHFYSKRNSNDGASIVAISSIASLTLEKGMLSYAMSKAAMNAAIKVMSKEFLKRKIRVNAILPGGVSTQMAAQKSTVLENIHNLAGNDENSSEQPLGNIPSTVIAEQVEFLLSEHARYTTGELVVVSGGRVF